MIAAGLCGALCAAGAWWWGGTMLGGLLWCGALAVASLGYGAVFARLAGRRTSVALAAVVGLSVVLVVGTCLAHLGLLRRPVQLAIIGVGLVACVAARPALDARAIPRGISVLVALAGILVVAVAIAGGGARVGDGVNHVLAVKRLWDTGALSVYHQAGAELVGESFAALATGAQTVMSFDEGVCAALLVWLLASELAGQEGELGIVLFVVLAVPAVLHPAVSQHDVGIWPAVLLELGIFVALRDAFAERRRGWLVLPPALALACLHHEYALLAAPCIAAALVLTPGMSGRRTVAILAAVWSVGLCAMALAFHLSLAGALWRLGAIWLAVPLAVTVLAALGVASPRTALGVLVFALMSFTLAVSVGAISPSFVAANALGAMWYGAGLAVACCIGDPRADVLRPIAAALVLCLLVAGTILDINLDDGERASTIARLAEPAAALHDIAALGLPTQAEDEVAALQQRVPRGARVDFWGQSAARLDFERDHIVDISWAPHEWRALYYLRPIAPGRLRRGDYVIVENMRAHAETDAWGTTRAAPTELVADRLAPVAIAGQARLYRVP